MLFLDDMSIGLRFELGTKHFTADEIKDFARRFDPQPFHTDEEAAKRSYFGKLCASGWHTACTWMRLWTEYGMRETRERLARGEPAAEMGPSPGFRELKWLNPVYADDTLAYVAEVTGTRPSRSRPKYGLLNMFNTATNQNGELVFSFNSISFHERRPTP